MTDSDSDGFIDAIPDSDEVSDDESDPVEWEVEEPEIHSNQPETDVEEPEGGDSEEASDDEADASSDETTPNSESVGPRFEIEDLRGVFETVREPTDPPEPGSKPTESNRQPAQTSQSWGGERRRERLHERLEAAGIDHPTRPATSKLTHDQMDLLVDLLEGFDSRREILQWQQDLVIQTVGQLEDSWYSRTAANAPTVSALLGEPWGTTEEMPAELAREVRRGIAAQDLLPAFHAGHEVARWAAVERVDHLDDDGEDGEDLDPIDPRLQEYALMRPAFGELYGQQEAALEDLLEGFETPEELLAWSHRVTSASYAQIDRETITAPYFETPLRDRLLGMSPTEEDRFIRESWACEYLLPAFNRAADALGQRAQEVTAGRGYQGDSGDGSIT